MSRILIKIFVALTVFAIGLAGIAGLAKRDRNLTIDIAQQALADTLTAKGDQIHAGRFAVRDVTSYGRATSIWFTSDNGNTALINLNSERLLFLFPILNSRESIQVSSIEFFSE